jgi:hypothetical protein
MDWNQYKILSEKHILNIIWAAAFSILSTLYYVIRDTTVH